MGNATKKTGIVSVSLLVGSTVGLLEATWLMEPAAGLVDGLLVLVNGMLAYAVGALVVSATWWTLTAPGDDGDTGQAASIAVAGAAALFAALLIIARPIAGGEAGAALTRLIAGSALGLTTGFVSRAMVDRVPVLGRVSVWRVVHGVVLVVAIGMVLLRSLPAGGSAPQGSPNVVLITIDTLRADHVGAYGYERSGGTITPHIDRMASDGVQFLQAVSPAPLTCPSHASILTGQYPVRHGALHNGAPLPLHSTTIAERLGDEGYATGAIVSGFTLKDVACGLGNRFDTFNDNFSDWFWLPDSAMALRPMQLFVFAMRRLGMELVNDDRPAGRTTDLAIDWLGGTGTKPFFLWVHYFDPHVPYEAPISYSTRYTNDPSAADGRWYQGVTVAEKEAVAGDPAALERMIGLYDGEISYVDAEVGRLRSSLNELGLADDTLLVFASDHGEGLGEHGLYFEHSNHLYDEELLIPLIFVLPDDETPSRQVPEQVRLIDVAPTVLEYLDMDPLPDSDGADLGPLISGESEAFERPAFAAVHPGVWESGRAVYALREPGHKLIWTTPEWLFLGLRVPGRSELYDLLADPRERRDIITDDPQLAARLRDGIETWRERESGVEANMSEETLRRLRSLGYVR